MDGLATTATPLDTRLNFMAGSLFGLLNIAQTGLAAQSAALDATGQNVSNVNTPGYSRVTANLETVATPDGYSGGVQIGGMDRSFSAITFGSMLTEQGLGGAASTLSQALSQTQNLVAPTTGSIGDNVDNFFTSYQTLETAPSDPSARAGVLAAASQLAESVSTTANGLATQQTALLTQGQGVATSLNQDLAEIATLNGQIAAATSPGNQPTDLEDQRDELASTVSTLIGAQVLTDSNGDYTILSSGTALVSNTNAATVDVTLDASNNLKITSTLSGATNDITQGVTAGTLGGIREARDTDIASVASQLDQFAFDLTTAVNAIQSAGYGLDGATGRDLFTQPTAVAGAAASMAVDPAVANDPSAIAASSTAAGLPGGNDAAVAMAQLATQPLGAATSPADAFAAIGGSLGNMASVANNQQALRQATITQAQNLNSSVSGVSLDQEMTNLDEFQRAYEASSQVLETADTLLGELMTAVANG
jgi:flagellar hook-associated protein 1 FlgK